VKIFVFIFLLPNKQVKQIIKKAIEFFAKLLEG